MSTTHLVAPEEIMALLDGELSADRAPFVSEHIEECVRCRQVAESLRGNSETLARWTVATAPAHPEFEARLLEAAKTSPWKRRSLGSIGTAAFLRRPWVVTVGTLALAACLALTFSTRSHRPGTKTVSWLNMPVDFARTEKAIPPTVPPTAKAQAQVSADSNSRPRSFAENKYKKWLSQDGQLGDQIETTVNALQAVPEPMIARTVSLSLIVKDFGTARASVDTILARYRGYSAELNVSTPQGAARRLEASLRVPAPQLSAAVAELKALGRAENEAQSGEEVTQQHGDLVARLKNSRETEQRLQAILLQRTGKIGDVLAVEQEIARVRGEIEQMEAQQKSLEHRVEFATINLALAEEYKAQIGSPSRSISTRFHNALVSGYRDVVETVVSIILFFAEYAPSLALWFALLFPVGWFVRRRWLRAQSFASSLQA
jgi:hypothetical protein